MALIGYVRVSKADGSQTTNLQRDALTAAAVDPEQLYEDKTSGKKDDRPELTNCLKALRDGDTLIVWKLDRLGRDLRHLINIVHDITDRGVGLKVLTGQRAAIDTTTASGKLVFGIFAALAEFERELISERTKAKLASARARGHKGGRPYKMIAAKLRLTKASMGHPHRRTSPRRRETTRTPSLTTPDLRGVVDFRHLCRQASETDRRSARTRSDTSGGECSRSEQHRRQ